MRKAAVVLLATEHGPMMINRLDHHSIDAGKSYSGVGTTLLGRSIYAEDEINTIIGLLEGRRLYNGTGVVAIDGGANIGVHTLSMARVMTGWGQVLAFEPQERIFYLLAGNIALNNLGNARAFLAALSNRAGTIDVPVIDYDTPSNFGALNIRPRVGLKDAEGKPIPECNIGQPVDYKKTTPVAALRLDDFNLPRLDLIKLDVEGMEAEVLQGARQTLRRCKPIVYCEKFICGLEAICAVVPPEYEVTDLCGYAIAFHKDDEVRKHVNFTGKEAASNAIPAEPGRQP